MKRAEKNGGIGGVRVIGEHSERRGWATAAGEPGDKSEPFPAEAFAALRARPEFRGVVEDLARANLSAYAAASPAERWLTSDLGRAALTGAAMVLDAILGGFTTAQMIHSARANRTCSDGRVRHYLRAAAAHGFLEVDTDGTHRASARLYAVMARDARTILTAVSRLDPELAGVADLAGDLAFRRRMAMHIGLNTRARPDLFAGPDMPVLLFLARDGGTRMMEQLITSQPPDRERLLERARTSQRALSRGAFVSRTHAARLLADGEAQGLLRAEGPEVVATPALSEDVERHYALVLEMARVSARAALDIPG
jgi:hypothetical protein